MKNWEEKIVQGDIVEAGRRAGVSPLYYNESKKIPVSEWMPRHLKINKALKELILEREALRSEFQEEKERLQKDND
jgi:hypothetical protein